MAKKFIDAEMLISELDASCMPIFKKGISGILGDEESIADVIRSQPAADVQEIVRCRDCKFNDNCSAQYYAMFKDIDYCSHGTKKDGDDNV